MGKMIYHIYETPFKPVEKEDGTFDYGTVPSEYYYDWMNDWMND